MPTLTVAHRFRGPADSANGGYVCGLIAGYLDGRSTVTLRRPPPLATPMTVDPDGAGGIRLRHGSTLVAEAAPARDGGPPPVPDAVSLAVSLAASLAAARAARAGARYFQDPVFPACFVCGPRRRPGDGLRIFPGQVTGRALWAAPWTPDASSGDRAGRVRPEIVWAALDCPSGIAAAEAADIGRDTVILLGRMTASVPVLPAVGDDCRVVAWPTGRDGRKLMAGSALLGPDGALLATAETVWLTVPRTVPGTAS